MADGAGKLNSRDPGHSADIIPKPGGPVDTQVLLTPIPFLLPLTDSYPLRVGFVAWLSEPTSPGEGQGQNRGVVGPSKRWEVGSEKVGSETQPTKNPQ